MMAEALTLSSDVVYKMYEKMCEAGPPPIRLWLHGFVN
jgi:hypothetical protein